MIYPVYDLLPIGQENAVSLAYIRAATGLNARAARREIAAERAAGKLILSSTVSSGGYFRPANVD